VILPPEIRDSIALARFLACLFSKVSLLSALDTRPTVLVVTVGCVGSPYLEANFGGVLIANADSGCLYAYECVSMSHILRPIICRH